MAGPNPSRVDFGSAMSGTFAALGQDWPTYITLSAVFVAVPTLVGGWLLSRMATAQDAGQGALVAIVYGKALIASIGGAAMRGGVMHGVGGYFAGRRASLGECFAVGLRLWLPLLGLTWVVGVAVGAACLLLVVPGLMLAMAWYVSAPVLVHEGGGVFNSISRSVELTRGNRMVLFGFALVVGIISFVASTAIGFVFGLVVGVTGATPEKTQMAQTLAVPLSYLLTFPFQSAAVTSVYRQLAPSGQTELLAQVFA